MNTFYKVLIAVLVLIIMASTVCMNIMHTQSAERFGLYTKIGSYDYESDTVYLSGRSDQSIFLGNNGQMWAINFGDISSEQIGFWKWNGTFVLYADKQSHDIYSAPMNIVNGFCFGGIIDESTGRTLIFEKIE